MHIYESTADTTRRQLEATGQRVGGKKPLIVAGETALSKGMTEFQKNWLLNYCTDQFSTLHSNLSSWRAKLEKFERMADDDYTDRKGRPDPERTDATKSIFDKQNHSLGVVSGFGDFVFCQARDDIYGTRPWIAATPQGVSDNDLSEKLPKHVQWKFDATNIEETLIDSARLAIDLGTQFVKLRWLKDVETYETAAWVAHSVTTGQPVLDAGGDYIRDVAGLEAIGADGEDIEWRELLIEETTTVYDNLMADNLDFKDVAFDLRAKELDLQYTDFFHRCRMGLLDAVAFYNIRPEDAGALLATVTDENSEARPHRDENSTTGGERLSTNNDANPQVVLVEGFVRVDPFEKGQPKRLHVVFIAESQVLLYAEYLANDSPGGILPVFPVRCFKTPKRIIGRGYFEKYEDTDTAIDAQYNSTTYHDRKAKVPLVGFQRDALLNELEGDAEIQVDPDKVYELAPGKTLEDLFQFLSFPDLNSRGIELMNQMIQLGQMRSGITSASQGELKGVPNASTATGVRQLTSRGAVLTKWPIEQIKGDHEKIAEYGVALIYANQNFDETFTWGEGKTAELLEIKAGDVRGLKMNVALTLTQSQNQSKLENAMAAANLCAQYVQIPEVEKEAVRPLYVQAITALGFNDADRIVRAAVTDPASIIAILPPDLQPAFQAFLQQSGMLGAPAPSEATPAQPENSHAPVTQAQPMG